MGRAAIAHLLRITLRAGALPALLLGGLSLYGRAVNPLPYAGTPALRHAPALVLPDDRGRMFDLAAERGKVVVVYFGYTHCPDVCPATLAALNAALHELGADAGRIEQVFVTIDPARDTADRLRAYLANFHPAPTGLVGTPQAIALAARAWGVTWRSEENGAYYDHSSVVTVIGPDGDERLQYGVSQLDDPVAMARDLERILHER